jgi:DNA-binding transcriptional regulator LsrR (DeoR family)
MRQVRKILRLHFDAGLSTRAIASQLGIGVTTVRDALKRFGQVELTWPLPHTISDSDLEQQLYVSSAKASRRQKKQAGLVLRCA